MWYNRTTSTEKIDRGAAWNSPRPDTKKGSFLMPPHHTAIAPGFKVCTKCGESKPATTEYFPRQNARRDGLNSWCKKCNRENCRVWATQNAERLREYRSVNKVRISERYRIWYQANRAHKLAYRAANKARYERLGRQWLDANRDKSRAVVRRRRALKRAAQGDHTADDIRQQYERQKGRCYYCKIEVGNDYHVDHVVPLARGGSNGPENLVVACPTCNRRKNDRLPHEWPEGNRLL